ncbi:MAG: S-layer protein, partial [Pirellulaceae bacterium]
MRRYPTAALPLAALIAPAFCLLSFAQETPAKPKAPGLGDPGKLVSIAVDSGRVKDGIVPLSGRDAVQQLVVTGSFDSGQTRDLTRKSTYEAAPAGIIAVDSTGLVTPIAEGQAAVKVVAEAGIEATVNVVVKDLVSDKPINFANQITPIFTKYSCNGGGCHGKSGGQNGFRLSLLGFEP